MGKDKVVDQLSGIFGKDFGKKLAKARKHISTFNELDAIDTEIATIGRFLDQKGKKTFGARFYMKIENEPTADDIFIDETDLTEEEYDEMFTLCKKVYKRYIDELFTKRKNLSDKLSKEWGAE